jgi:outer membrane protein assembly factor BamB
MRPLLIVTVMWVMMLSGSSSAMTAGPLGSRIVDLVASDNGVIVAYCGAERESWVVSYDAQTGGVRWRKHFPRIVLAGHLSVSDKLLCAPTFADGVYVLNLLDGTLKARLRTGKDATEPRVGCTSGRILVANAQSDWDANLVAFDTTRFHPIWRRTIPRSYVWKVFCAVDTFELLLSEPFGPGPSLPPRRYEKISIGAQDGRVLSRKSTARPADYDMIPGRLPAAMRKWLTQLLRRKGGVFLPRTRIERLGALWLVGNVEDRTAPSRVFAIRGDAAEVVWQRDAPGLADIILHKDRLIVAAVSSHQAGTDRINRTKGKLTALDAQTGRVLWTAELADSL